MRVLIATDRIGGLDSSSAGNVLAAGWHERGHRVLTVPVGEAGEGFLGAAADRYGLTVSVEGERGVLTSSAVDHGIALLRVEDPEVEPGVPLGRSSAPLGHALRRILDTGCPRRVLVDLTGCAVHDAGAGMLSALGLSADRALTAGAAGLARVRRVDVAPARARLAGVELVGVVPVEESSRALVGLRGITSYRGREAGLDPSLLLQTDDNLSGFARLVDAEAMGRPGAGACGGLGFAVLALGGSLRTGTALALHETASADAPPRPDLVLTGCSAFDFGTRGGGVVATAATYAAGQLAPCVVLAGEVLIGSREMRTLGVEAAYAVHDSRLDGRARDVTAEELAKTAARVIRSWSW